MASSKDRQRKLARAKLDRQMARRAGRSAASGSSRPASADCSRSCSSACSAAWSARRLRREAGRTRPPTTCAWTPQDAGGQPEPQGRRARRPTSGMPTSGTSAMTRHHRPAATIVVDLDRHRRPVRRGQPDVPRRQQVLRQHQVPRDHPRRGRVRAALRRPERHRPRRPDVLLLRRRTCRPRPRTRARPRRPPRSAAAAATPSPSAATAVRYPAGTIAMTPNSNGSQFLIFFKDFDDRDRVLDRRQGDRGPRRRREDRASRHHRQRGGRQGQAEAGRRRSRR